MIQKIISYFTSWWPKKIVQHESKLDSIEVIKLPRLRSLDAQLFQAALEKNDKLVNKLRKLKQELRKKRQQALLHNTSAFEEGEQDKNGDIYYTSNDDIPKSVGFVYAESVCLQKEKFDSLLREYTDDIVKNVTKDIKQTLSEITPTIVIDLTEEKQNDS